jgi:hypothetical protein
MVVIRAQVAAVPAPPAPWPPPVPAPPVLPPDELLPPVEALPPDELLPPVEVLPPNAVGAPPSVPKVPPELNVPPVPPAGAPPAIAPPAAENPPVSVGELSSGVAVGPQAVDEAVRAKTRARKGVTRCEWSMIDSDGKQGMRGPTVGARIVAVGGRHLFFAARELTGQDN